MTPAVSLVPPSSPVLGAEPLDAAVDALDGLLRGRRVFVLSGAGLSTDSGIPDYRGPETRHRARNPIRYNAFVDTGPDGVAARQRYWARASVGWGRIAHARPNDGHAALARLEDVGVVAGVLTQNVDGLHAAAGSRRVVELHGALARVRCLACGARHGRDAVQRWAEALNPGHAAHRAEAAPDGDVELSDDAIARFVVPTCPGCAGALKPDVVFFGECLAPETAEAAWRLYDEADALLVVGSSLAVYSGLRYVHRAARDGKPVAIVTLGGTRGDAHAAVRVDAPLSTVLPALAERLA